MSLKSEIILLRFSSEAYQLTYSLWQEFKTCSFKKSRYATV